MRPVRLVQVPITKTLIKDSPGFLKKRLSDAKIDLLARCEFQCSYCSSDWGNFLRIMREPFADLTEQQLGERVYPADDHGLMLGFRQDVVEHLARELDGKRASFGSGKTLVFSMLTDGFSPSLVRAGTTRAVLDLLLKRTSYRIRILTKNGVVGHAEWVTFFLKHPDRFVVGLSCGTLNREWAKAVEGGTSSPASRLRSLRALQDAGVPTYGMMCPVFPDVLHAGALDELIDAIRPERCETVWAEPYNDRVNWREVRSGYAPGSAGWDWFSRVYEQGERDEWSRYASELFTRLQQRAIADGWIAKLVYLLYEHGIAEQHASAFADPRGLSLQSPPGPDGKSQNPHIHRVLERAGAAFPFKDEAS